MMKPALQMQIGQHLTLTPQLQQAIRLLQLSTIELQQEIQENLNSNPLLEAGEDNAEDNLATSEQDDRNHSAPVEKEESSDSSHADLEATLNQEKLPDELPGDTGWEDVWQSQPSNSKQQDEFDTQETQRSKQESLQEHLLWQTETSRLSEEDKMIAIALIDAINEYGFLSCPLEDIQESINKQSIDAVELDEIEAVLHQIQNFEPIGIGARNLQECLLLQLKNLPDATPGRDSAILICDQYFALLVSKEYTQLLRKTKLSEQALKAVLVLIQQLNPRPGNSIEDTDTNYVLPDVVVFRRRDQWVVELNQEALPKVRINQTYASIMQSKQRHEDTQYLRQQMQEARWFLKSLQSRNETLLKVANAIIEYQADFLDHGAEHMKPLILHHVADQIGMHESTVSRITTQKFMETPRGIFELKYFFSSHVGTQNGGECSSTAIRARIKKLITEESTHKPLSDSKIATVLGKEGINIARRTVAKYREALRIPPSNERKSMV